MLSPLGRVASECEPIAVCLNSLSFRGFPLGGGSLRSKVVRGVVIRIPASRVASNFNTCFPLWGEWRATASRERSVKFSVFSRLPLGGRLLAKQGGEGCRYPHTGKQSGEQLQHLLSPLGRVANESEPREVCLNSPPFRGFPLGGGSLRSKAVRGIVIRIPASRAASEYEPIAVFKTYPPPCMSAKNTLFQTV